MENISFTLGLWKRVSGKTGNPYVCFAADLGYRKLVLSFDKGQIVELLGLSYSAYSALEYEILQNNGTVRSDFFPLADVKIKDKIV